MSNAGTALATTPGQLLQPALGDDMGGGRRTRRRTGGVANDAVLAQPDRTWNMQPHYRGQVAWSQRTQNVSVDTPEACKRSDYQPALNDTHVPARVGHICLAIRSSRLPMRRSADSR